jgi:hypothetical protein
MSAKHVYCDIRFGGKPRYAFTDKPECLMQVPDTVRKCVAFVGARLPTDEFSPQGTAFFMARLIPGVPDEAFVSVVTAKHVISGMEEAGYDKVYLRLNFKDGNAYLVESDFKDWQSHPDESEVDVAVLPFFDWHENEYDHLIIHPTLFYNSARITIGTGDEVFLPGLFVNHYGRNRNIPIVRVGNIAAMPEEKVLTKAGLIDAYLVEARSIGGLSGSPVFVHLGYWRNIDGTLMQHKGPHGGYHLVGLMHGHYKVKDVKPLPAITSPVLKKEYINMGIAIVVPLSKIMEVVEQPNIMKEEAERIKEVLAELLPTPDSVEQSENSITKKSFENVLRRVSRKSSEPELKDSEMSE